MTEHLITQSELDIPMRLSEIAHHLYHSDGLLLITTAKAVKNVNFILKDDTIRVSHPTWLLEPRLVAIIADKLPAIKRAHARQKQRNKYPANNASGDRQPTLWGEPLADSEALHDVALLAMYRQALTEVLPSLATTWQSRAGLFASDIRIKKMRTRWGSCNTRTGRIWLSVYLAGYPRQCTEYVLVHELCHLRHANHGREFWALVTRVMPDYQRWHALLKDGMGGDVQKSDA